jgi:hypothetical protein
MYRAWKIDIGYGKSHGKIRWKPSGFSSEAGLGGTGFHVLGSMRHKVSVSQRRRRQSFRSLPDNGSENRFNVVEEKIWAGSHIYRFHHFHLNLNLPD